METLDIIKPSFAGKHWANNWSVFSINDCWQNEHRELEYHNQPFNNPEDVAVWQRAGYPPQRFTGDMYDMRYPEPRCISQIQKQIPLRKFSWSFYRMLPGNILPEHRDTYARFKEVHELATDTSICRYVVFLEPWASGHYFEIDGKPLTGWSKGTTVCWINDVIHIAANIGMTPRYTLQLTGILEHD